MAAKSFSWKPRIRSRNEGKEECYCSAALLHPLMVHKQSTNKFKEKQQDGPLTNGALEGSKRINHNSEDDSKKKDVDFIDPLGKKYYCLIF